MPGSALPFGGMLPRGVPPVPRGIGEPEALGQGCRSVSNRASGVLLWELPLVACLVSSTQRLPG